MDVDKRNIINTDNLTLIDAFSKVNEERQHDVLGDVLHRQVWIEIHLPRTTSNHLQFRVIECKVFVNCLAGV